MDLQGAFAEAEGEDFLDLRGVGGFGDDVLACERASEASEQRNGNVSGGGRTGDTEGDGTESDESGDIRGGEEHTVGPTSKPCTFRPYEKKRTALSGGSAPMPHRVGAVG